MKLQVFQIYKSGETRLIKSTEIDKEPIMRNEYVKIWDSCNPSKVEEIYKMDMVEPVAQMIKIPSTGNYEILLKVFVTGKLS